MSTFKCQMVDYDDPEEWHEVEAFGPDDAAQEYAEKCDSRSGGLNRPSRLASKLSTRVNKR